MLGLIEVITVGEKLNDNYSGRPVGNCVEAMTLDNILFRDVRNSMDYHVESTSTLPLDNPLRFHKATPKEI